MDLILSNPIFRMVVLFKCSIVKFVYVLLHEIEGLFFENDPHSLCIVIVPHIIGIQAHHGWQLDVLPFL